MVDTVDKIVDDAFKVPKRKRKRRLAPKKPKNVILLCKFTSYGKAYEYLWDGVVPPLSSRVFAEVPDPMRQFGKPKEVRVVGVKPVEQKKYPGSLKMAIRVWSIG